MYLQNLTTEKLKTKLNDIILNKIYTCKKCSSKCVWMSKIKFKLIYSWRSCKNKQNALENSIFFNSKLKLDEILSIIGLWAHNISTNNIALILQISRQSVSKVLRKKGDKLVTNYYCNLPKLGGENIIVEIDESKFRKRKYNRRHHVEGVWVFGIVERTTQRKILLFPVK
ncbi:hypothetical protein H312_03572 [Anncaliia algerae PRA339]|uniref:ISXO2-like transposase domain-containing protein n=1 Tax=Anncaliia algerae PRA339 TaxID=1288291 RepID=A0A059EVZ3_9MICR|nr:hypothetical protein H312_03572 [Anncaliia algerae PRA339]